MPKLTIANAVHCTEECVSLPNGIAATLALPIGDQLFPAVLLLHGFGSCRDEVGDLFTDVALKLAAQHIGTLRIDFRGCGDSPGAFSDLTIERLIEDTETAYPWLAALPQVDRTRIGLLGFSLGAGIGILVSAAHPKWFKSMVVWSPTAELAWSFQRALGEESFLRAEREGIVTVDLGWRSVTLKSEFFHSLARHDVNRAIASYPGSFLAIAGSVDRSARHAQNLVQAKMAHCHLEIIPGADHIFGVLSDGRGTASIVRGQTVSWFSEKL